jgi:exosortase N
MNALRLLLVYIRIVMGRELGWLIGWVGLAVAGGAIAFPPDFLTGSNVLIGFCLFPFVLLVKGKQRVNYIYLAIVFLLGLVAYSYTVRTFYFLALFVFILFLLEMYLGQLDRLVLFLLLFMSPFIHQIIVILGFPIRLQLSGWAGQLLSLAGMNIQVEGNMMILDGATFSVDDACIGLNMLATSLLMGVFLLAHQYHTRKLSLPFLHLVMFFAIVFVLNIGSNLLRIVMLVLFRIAPEHTMHEITGIACMLVYCVVPLYFAGKWMVGKFGKPFTRDEAGDPINITSRGKIILTVISFVILATGVGIRQRQSTTTLPHIHFHREGFETTLLDAGVTKVHNKDLLLYLKTIPEFFSAEHTPLFCWKGTGYSFKEIKKTTIHGHEIYIGRLRKSSDMLYTAWWYSNGTLHTIDQLTWRLHMLTGKPRFVLVNVTANSEEVLLKEMNTLLSRENLFVNP